MEHRTGFGIIGCGMIANFHAKAINAIDNTHIACVFDTIENTAMEFSKKYNTEFTTNIDDILNNEQIKIVCICTPSGLHKDIALKAIRAGKNVVIEKPMALTPQECDEIIEECKKFNVQVAVISQLRFTKAITALKKAIEEEKLGKLICGDVYMKFYRSPEYYKNGGWRGTWKMDGGGALMNQGIHGIDLLQYLMGKVTSVYAKVKTMVHDIEVEDTATAIVEFENGALGIIQGTTSVMPGYPRRIEICGSLGSATIEENNVIAWNIPDAEYDMDNQESAIKAFNDPTALDVNGHIRQIEDLIEAIKTGRKPFVDQNEGRKPVEIICAIYESSKTGRRIEL